MRTKHTNNEHTNLAAVTKNRLDNMTEANLTFVNAINYTS